MKNIKNIIKVQPRQKLIYNIPTKKAFYTSIFKNIKTINDNNYRIVQVKNLRHYFQNNKHEK